MTAYWGEPSVRILNLVTEGPLLLTDSGFGMWCYTCESIVPITIPEESDEAIIEAAYQYGDHNRGCLAAKAARS